MDFEYGAFKIIGATANMLRGSLLESFLEF